MQPTPRAEDSNSAHDPPPLPGYEPLEYYTPTADTAECPRCGVVVAGIPAAFGPAVWMASFAIKCPGCGRTWSEFRSPDLGASRGPARQVRDGD
ncbi:MAG TPA: hypothetical protein VII06_43115 [Chloroflexota bacterium]|jgi:endogenous inhibitor of DNA gyrase (YacG/DUF329 family)